jgi:hypothetical protein
MIDPTKTTYGKKRKLAARTGRIFFPHRRWEGTRKTKLENGEVAAYGVTWIGRYILDGTAIADEFHSIGPGGHPYLGISFRQMEMTFRRAK